MYKKNQSKKSEHKLSLMDGNHFPVPEIKRNPMNGMCYQRMDTMNDIINATKYYQLMSHWINVHLAHGIDVVVVVVMARWTSINVHISSHIHWWWVGMTMIHMNMNE